MRKKLLLSAVALLLYIANAGSATYYVNSLTGNNLFNGLYPVFISGLDGPKKTIQGAVSVSASLDTILIAPGLYTESVIINVQLVMAGAGSQDDTLLNTIIQAPAPGTGTGITIGTGGTSTASRLYLGHLQVRGFSNGITYTSHTTYDNVAVNNNSYGFYHGSGAITDIIQTHCTMALNTQAGIFIGHAADVDGWLIDSCLFDENNYSGLYVFCDNPSTADCRNVIIRNSLFRKNFQKGMYIEKLRDALFENLVFDSCGYNTAYNFNTAVDINLKFNNYSNITIRSCELHHCGIGGTDAFGCGLIIKGRDDGPTYGANPATLDSVRVENLIVTGCRNGIILGEPGAANLTPTNVQVEFCHISGSQLYGFVSEIKSDAMVHNNWWGVASGPDTADIKLKSTGSADVITWLTSGTDIMPATPGFQYQETATFNPSLSSLQDALDAVPDSFTLIVKPSHYQGQSAIDKTLTILPCQNVIIDTLVVQSPANLLLKDTALTINHLLDLKSLASAETSDPAMFILGSGALLSEVPGNRIIGVVRSERNVNATGVQFDFQGTGLIMTSISSSSHPGNTEVIRRTYPAAPHFPGQIPRVFEINAQNNQNLNVTLIYRYDPVELAMITHTGLLSLFHSSDNGINWLNTGGALDTVNNRIVSAVVHSVNGLWTGADSWYSTEEISDNRNIQIFPNPADKQIFIEMTGPDKCLIMQLYNTRGQRIFHHKAHPSHVGQNGTMIQCLSLTDVPDGLYILNIMSSSGLITSRKVMVCHP